MVESQVSLSQGKSGASEFLDKVHSHVAPQLRARTEKDVLRRELRLSLVGSDVFSKQWRKALVETGDGLKELRQPLGVQGYVQ